MQREKILLIYDRECPVCNVYCQLVKIEETVGDLVIVNARDHSQVLDEITQSGFDVDQGMVLKMGDQLYYGADAINRLALISSRSGVFNRLNYYIFKSKSLSSVCYPILRSARNLLLKILGKSKINNLGSSNNEKF